MSTCRDAAVEIMRERPLWSFRRACLLLVCTFVASSQVFAAIPSVDETKLPAKIREGIERLNDIYWSKTLNIWFDKPGDDLRAHYEGRLNPPWWPSANAVELLMDYADVTGDATFEPSIRKLYDLQKNRRERASRVAEELRRRGQWSDADEARWQKQKAGWRKGTRDSGYYTNFQNEYLDDSGWWGVTWLKMYARHPEVKYLRTAETIHAHMARNWRPQLGGGVLWCEDEDKQKANTITNGLFLLLSARLHTATGDAKYLEWAQRTLAWFNEKAIFDGSGLVDAPGHQGDHWSYNQGVFIGALTALSQATGDPQHLQHAVKVADGALNRAGLIAADGVLVEKCGTSGDASLFKGVLARYLGQLRDELRLQKLHPEMAVTIDLHLRRTAEAILARADNDGLYPADWHTGGANQATGFNQQVSALAALMAVLPGRTPPLKKPVGR